MFRMFELVDERDGVASRQPSLAAAIRAAGSDVTNLDVLTTASWPVMSGHQDRRVSGIALLDLETPTVSQLAGVALDPGHRVAARQ